MNPSELQEAMRLPQFPLSAKYDIAWLAENEMGPCSTWLAEFLLGAMEVRPGMKVLDLGCGKAMSSIFLARECGAQIWATDLWIGATENMVRVSQHGVEDKVFPIRSEAHSMPFANGFFDAVVSLDAYHYFGTNELYLPYIVGFLKPRGRIGIVVPGVSREITAEDVRRIGAQWDPSYFTFHGPDWWKDLWQRSTTVAVETADVMPHGHEVWLRWDQTLKQAGVLKRNGDVALLEADGGNLTFTRVVARKV
jgi:cyclopropane fatty-acyl-phospholipid synthase-like methyltransferase